jgi:excisionase family DNA binding protein
VIQYNKGGELMDKLLDPNQVAAILNVSPKTVRDWLRAGKLQGVRAGKLWRVESTEVGRFIEENKSKRK